jgi:effector-binding domain-containing protein
LKWGIYLIRLNHELIHNELKDLVRSSAEETWISEIHKDFEDIRFKEIQPIKVASLTFKGEYPQLYVVNTDIAKWVNENGYDFNGNIFNIYHISPKTEHQPKEMITEV